MKNFRRFWIGSAMLLLFAVTRSDVLAGQGGFRVAWREPIAISTEIQFIVGGAFMGGGSQMLALVAWDNRDVPQQTLSICRWREGVFNVDSPLFSQKLDDPLAGFSSLLTSENGKGTTQITSYIVDRGAGRINLWQYQTSKHRWCHASAKSSCKITTFLGGTKPRFAGVCSAQQSGNIKRKADLFVSSIPLSPDNLAIFNRSAELLKGFPRHTSMGDTCLAADLDGDGNIEWLFIPFELDSQQPLEIYGNDRKLRFKSEAGYDHLAAWKPVGAQESYVAASDGDSVHIYRWTGSTCRLVWKSQKFGGNITALTVCDPKNEGKSGLIVAGRDTNGHGYVAKIVAL